MKRAAIFAASLTLALSTSVQAQQAESVMSLDTLLKLDDGVARGRGLPIDALRELRGVALEEAKDHPATFDPHGKAGLLIRVGPDGKLVTTRVPSDIPNDVLIDPSAFPTLANKPRAWVSERFLEGVRVGATESILARIAANAQTVDPGDTSNLTMPKAWADRAKLFGVGGAAGVSPCSSSQQAFASEAEYKLLGPQGKLGIVRLEGERIKLISDIKAFDQACLEKVTVDGGHLASLAVITGPDGAFCMATHLGGDRFLTARHCFYDPNSGELRPEAKVARLSMADKSALDLPVMPALAQPIAAPDDHASSRADILVITVAGLPAAVQQLKGPTIASAADFPKLIVAEAQIVGYFVLADPERVLPKALGHSDLPDWSQSLRATRLEGPGYCRVWDYTPPRGDGTACLQHSCQTVKGFSGAPIFVRPDPNKSDWVVAGVHVDTSENAGGKDCGDFVGAKLMKAPDRAGLLNGRGGLAAAVPTTLIAALSAADASADH